jgi:hypothetical protein
VGQVHGKQRRAKHGVRRRGGCGRVQGSAALVFPFRFPGVFFFFFLFFSGSSGGGRGVACSGRGDRCSARMKGILLLHHVLVVSLAARLGGVVKLEPPLGPF